ncbi:Uncharacterised protein [Kocuria rosea]|nr:Uncharacterised protein [Kocuria rosea]
MQVDALRSVGRDVFLVAEHGQQLSPLMSHRLKAALTVATAFGPSRREGLHRYKPRLVQVHNLFPSFVARWTNFWCGPVIATPNNLWLHCPNAVKFRDGSPFGLCPRKGSHHANFHMGYRGSGLAPMPIVFGLQRGSARNRLVTRADLSDALFPRLRGNCARYQVYRAQFDSGPSFTPLDGRFPSSATILATWLHGSRLARSRNVLKLVRNWSSSVPLAISENGQAATAVAAAAKGNADVSFLGSMPRDWMLGLPSRVKGMVIPNLWAEEFPPVELEALAVGRPAIPRRRNSAADDMRRGPTTNLI